MSKILGRDDYCTSSALFFTFFFVFLIQWKVKHLVRIIRFGNGLVVLQNDQNGPAVDMEDDPYISPSDICVFLRMDEIMDLIIFGFKTNMRQR